MYKYYIILLLVIFPSYALANKISVRVLDEESKTGVMSEIYHYNEFGNKKRYGATDSKGIIAIERGRFGQRISVNPFSKGYYVKELECPIIKKDIYIVKINYYLVKDINKSLSAATNVNVSKVKVKIKGKGNGKFTGSNLLDELTDSK